MSSSIHPTAIVSPTARLGHHVHLGPFSIVEDDAVVGDRCIVSAHAVIKQGTVLGEQNEISEGAVLGGKPQHIRGDHQFGGLRIGRGNRIRENATVHRGLNEGQDTTIGDHNLIMVNAHIAHDCRIGDNTIIVNNAMLAGHVIVEDRAYISGAVGVHQFCRIGQFAMIGGQAHIVQDVPPFVTVDGATSRVVGLNRVGLRRNGFQEPQMTQLKAAYRLIYRCGLKWSEVLETLRTRFPDGPAAAFLPFLSTGKRGFIQERHLPRTATIKLPSSDERDYIENEFRRVG